MPLPRDPATLMAAARLYYLEGRSQAEIADVMGTSRSNVSRMLSEAQRQGIVEIRIHDPGGRVPELEEQLTEQFGLREARVAHVGTTPGLALIDQVGVQAARLLADLLRDSMTIALSWGHAIQAMVFATAADHEHHGVNLVQLVGGLSSVNNEVSGQELVRELARRLNAGCTYLHAPATLESRASRDALLAEPSITEALETASRADLAIVGIGTPARGSSAAILDALNLTATERHRFEAAGPVGDIAARYYGPAGQAIHGPVEDRILALGLDDLIALPHVVGVAHGRAKAPGVLGALRGHLIDSLVCDEPLARHLLSDARTPSVRDERDEGVA